MVHGTKIHPSSEWMFQPHAHTPNTAAGEGERPRSVLSMAAASLAASNATLHGALDPGAAPAIEQDGWQRLLPPFLRMKFADLELENLFTAYRSRIKRESLMSFLVLSVLCDVHAVLLAVINYHADKLACVIIAACHLAIVAIISLLHRLRRLPDAHYAALPYLVWLLLCALLYTELVLNTPAVTPRTGLAWQLVLLHAAFTTLPLPLPTCLALAGLAGAAHLTLLVALSVRQGTVEVYQLLNMIIANCLLCVCATLLGVTGFIIADAAIRRSFLKTKQSLSIYIEMEEGSKQQESLLLSVLPTHVAREMVKDLDKNVTSQFRKIYMNRHENVSILFADIVGFTAMSSTVTAAELIIILNDLFATFDKLAHKYHQLRIKILGDCYYCICGCPSPRADHAVLCIHMGLAMVDAIKGVQEKTQSDVNMRVGVHTGAVLGGVLGQVRWQYDVLGKEVTLANKMESGGLPGRVHISATTASFLRGEFSLEPGDGASREEGIKMANMTTFLIKGVLKKYPQGTLDDPALKKDKRDKKSKRGKRSPRPPPRETLHEVTHIPEMPDAQSKERLYRALMDRENNTLIYKELHKISMNFENKEMEAQYAKQRQVIGGHALVMASLVAILTSAAQFLVLPRDLLTTTTFAVGTALLINMTIISLPPSFPKHFPPFMIKMSKNIEASKCLLLIWVVSAVVILALTTSVQIIVCDTSVGSELNDTVNATVNESVISSSTTNSEKCYYPTYYIDSGVLVMLLITLITPLSFLIKNAMTSLLCVLYCLLANIFYEKPFNDFDDVLLNQIRNHDGFVSTKYATTITIVCIAVFLLHYSRYFDRLSRKLYYYHHEVEEMQHQLEDLKAKNQKLIFNILPPYVAKDFIGKLKEDEELYSQSYGLVGVMFAACPNFHDFYTEVAVNNNGLECFRVLNEIISDYDDLLNESRFQTIVKIKTIGPTFMAASGMTEDAFCVGKNKWAHLRDLVEFAFAMKECLQRINTQSFNNFMLRIGINQGPILAGVIGAKKPHYDIWGNTVNVASRMESTGQLGKIQVVEETMLILKEFGYKFEPRGFVMVKGKGNLMTYFLTGKDSASALSSTLLPNQINDFHANDMKITT